MTRGEEGTSTSQACRKQGPVRGTGSSSHIISSLTVEELRSYCEVPENIDLKLMDEPDESTLNREHNVVFFTLEQLMVGLRFPVSALFKELLHFMTRLDPETLPRFLGWSRLLKFSLYNP